jgi:UDP-3-O-[3-hydroxymyristoyl] glucosamine N-acyltransferase
MGNTLSDMARLVAGQVVGDPTIPVTGVNTIEAAKPGEITWVSHPRFFKKAAETKATALLAKKVIPNCSASFLLVADPRQALVALLHFFHPPELIRPGIDPRAVVGQTVSLGQNIAIGPYAVIEDGVTIGNGVRIDAGTFVGKGSEIGDGVHLYPHVTLYEKTKVGQRVIIHSGTVVGSDGFGFILNHEGYLKIPQVGNVVIEDDVELGAKVTIDRATMEQTVIGRGTKVGDQVHIGHNVKIGSHTIIVTQVGIGGSVQIGSHVILAGQVGVVDNVQIGDGAIVGARSMVTKDIGPGEKVSGFPPLPHRKWLAAQGSLQHLPELRAEVKTLQKKVQQLESRHSGDH